MYSAPRDPTQAKGLLNVSSNGFPFLEKENLRLELGWKITATEEGSE